MSELFNISIKIKDNIALIRLSGIIDEDNSIIEETGHLNQPILLIHMAKVNRINSCGVRDWLSWIEQQQDKQIIFLECSYTIISQANLINNFFGGGRVVKFMAPYYCEKCDIDEERLIAVAELPEEPAFDAPSFICNHCGHVLEFDEYEDSFFIFLDTINRQPIPADIAEKIKTVVLE